MRHYSILASCCECEFTPLVSSLLTTDWEQNGLDGVLAGATNIMEVMMAATHEKTLEDLFLNTLKDIYYAEKKILKALPKLAKAAQSEQASAAFLKHRDETEVQIERLEQVFEMLGKAARGKTCDAIEGIMGEGEEIIEEFGESPAIDAGLIAAAQAVEHYEIARYGTLKAWAGQLNMKDAVRLFDQTLREEIKTDELLTKLGVDEANAQAA
jgi:ferritin-like metal-binding protein YciE